MFAIWFDSIRKLSRSSPWLDWWTHILAYSQSRLQIYDFSPRQILRLNAWQQQPSNNKKSRDAHTHLVRFSFRPFSVESIRAKFASRVCAVCTLNTQIPLHACKVVKMMFIDKLLCCDENVGAHGENETEVDWSFLCKLLVFMLCHFHWQIEFMELILLDFSTRIYFTRYIFTLHSNETVMVLALALPVVSMQHASIKSTW